MNAKTFLAFLLCVIVSFLSACGNCSKKIGCPGYKDDTLDSWFPYKDNQQIVFLGNNNQSDTFTLKNTETTKPYQATGGALGAAPYCEAKKAFNSFEVDGFGRTKANIELNSTANQRQVYYTIGNNGFSIHDFKSSGLGQVSAGGRTLVPQAVPVVTIGSRTFYNVIEALGDTANSKLSGIYKLYYKQGEGLISYSEYPSLQTWTKQ